jgi:hypothetical protein
MNATGGKRVKEPSTIFFHARTLPFTGPRRMTLISLILAADEVAVEIENLFNWHK